MSQTEEDHRNTTSLYSLSDNSKSAPNREAFIAPALKSAPTRSPAQTRETMITEIYARWIPNNDPRLPTSNNTFTFAAMLVGTQTLVVIPGRKKLVQFMDMINRTYGPSLTLPDLYGFRGIQTISTGRAVTCATQGRGTQTYGPLESEGPLRSSGSQDVPPDTPNKTLVLWSGTRSGNICLYNLTILQAIIACRGLTGYTPCNPSILSNTNETEVLQSLLW